MISKSGVDLSVCAYCKCRLDDYSRTVDHLIPKSRGGKLSNANKVPSCGDCNKMKIVLADCVLLFLRNIL